MHSLEILLGSILDYAGTFPPARLGLAEALANYARERAGRDARWARWNWMLGRFVLSAASLHEFETIASSFVDGAGADPWPVTLILSHEPANEINQVESFNLRWKGRVRIVSVEFPPLEPSEIDGVAHRLPEGLDAFFEVPAEANLGARLAAIAASGTAAKIRAGGVTADAFPDPMQLVRFIRSCTDRQVAFKATAGLHHALGGCYPLTYEPDSARVVMHGFLNVAVAAALIGSGKIGSTEAVAILQESSPEAFTFLPDGLAWQDRMVALADIAELRRRLFRYFGSCSFREPAEDLEKLRLQ